MQTVLFQLNFESKQKNCTSIFENPIKIWDEWQLEADEFCTLSRCRRRRR